jgi:hypothetical protein
MQKSLIEEKGTQDTLEKSNESKLTESKLEQKELIKKSLEHKSELDKIVDESKKSKTSKVLFFNLIL